MQKVNSIILIIFSLRLLVPTISHSVHLLPSAHTNPSSVQVLVLLQYPLNPHFGLGTSFNTELSLKYYYSYRLIREDMD